MITIISSVVQSNGISFDLEFKTSVPVVPVSGSMTMLIYVQCSYRYQSVLQFSLVVSFYHRNEKCYVTQIIKILNTL